MKMSLFAKVFFNFHPNKETIFFNSVQIDCKESSEAKFNSEWNAYDIVGITMC